MATLVLVDSQQKLETLRHYADNASTSFQWLAVCENSIDRPIDLSREQALTLHAELRRAADQNWERVVIASSPGAAGDALACRLADALSLKNGRVHRLFLPLIDRREFFADPVKSAEWRHSAVYDTLLEVDRRVDAALRRLLKVPQKLPVFGLAAVAALGRIARLNEAPSASKDVGSRHLALVFECRKARIVGRLEQINGKPPVLSDRNVIKAVVIDLKEQRFSVDQVEAEEQQSSPPPPFTAGSLFAAAERELYFSAQKTLSLALSLYEGCNIGLKHPVGLITYPLTVSSSVPTDVALSAREYILTHFGKEYLPTKARWVEEQKGARVGAVRPTAFSRSPKKLKKYLSEEAHLLYGLIWQRLLVSQMTAINSLVRRVVITGGPQRRYIAVAETETVLNRGYLTAGGKSPFAAHHSVTEEMNAGHKLELASIELIESPASTHALQMGDVLEELCAGYCLPEQLAMIPETLSAWCFVQEGALQLSTRGQEAYRLLQSAHPELFNDAYLDKFLHRLAACCAHDGSAEKLLTDFAKLMEADRTQSAAPVAAQRFYGHCDECDHELIVKVGRYGRFLACSDFPRCNSTKPFPAGVRCPAEGCTGEIVERMSKKGATFFACSRYPHCRFSSRQKPVNAACPSCGNAYVVEANRGSRQVRLRCPKCRYEFEDNIEFSGQRLG